MKRTITGGWALAVLLAGGASFAQRADSSAPSSFLGIYTRSNSNVLDETAAYEGITVTRVVENSPGAAAGVKEEDVLLEANGIAMNRPNQLTELVASLPVGATVKMRIEGDLEVIELEAQTVARVAPPETEEADADKTWIERRRVGFEFKRPDTERAARLSIDPGQGIVVTRIAPKSPLREADIGEGDVLVEIDGEPILAADEFLKYVESLKIVESVRLSVIDEDGSARGERVELYQPDRHITKFRLPLLFRYERTRDEKLVSLLFGLYRSRRVENGASYRLLYFISFDTGAWDELIEMEEAR